MIASDVIVATIPQGDNNRYFDELEECLTDLVLRHQVHHCRIYCEKDDPRRGLSCRFGYPKAPRYGPTTYDAETNRFVYHRDADAARVNTYNSDVLRYAQCNIDLQYNIGDQARYYLCKYTTKGGPVLTGELVSGGAGAGNSVSIRYRQLGMMDILYDVLGYHLHGMSHGTIYLPTDLPENRFRVLKRARELREQDPESTEIFLDDPFKKYLDRPTSDHPPPAHDIEPQEGIVLVPAPSSASTISLPDLPQPGAPPSVSEPEEVDFKNMSYSEFMTRFIKVYKEPANRQFISRGVGLRVGVSGWSPHCFLVGLSIRPMLRI